MAAGIGALAARGGRLAGAHGASAVRSSETQLCVRHAVSRGRPRVRFHPAQHASQVARSPPDAGLNTSRREVQRRVCDVRRLWRRAAGARCGRAHSRTKCNLGPRFDAVVQHAGSQPAPASDVQSGDTASRP